MAVDAAWWRGKRVFVTGHTGFKGSWLALWLGRLGARISGLALAPATTPNLHDAAGVGAAANGQIGDVRDLDDVAARIRHAEPEIVFHLAAQSLVRYSFEHPLETFATNIAGTANVLEAIRRTPSVRVAVIVTSDKCYSPASGDKRHAENDALGGVDPYSASKAGAELVTAAIRSSFFISREGRASTAIATARAGNVIGGGDWARDRLVPDLLAAFRAGSAAHIRNPNAIRPWQHVLDPLRGYLVLAQRLWDSANAFSEAWNFGPQASHERPVSWIADETAARWGGGAKWERDASAHPKETETLRLDSKKAHDRLGWWTQLALPEAIEWTVAWHRAFEGGSQARELVERDIARYESAVIA